VTVPPIWAVFTYVMQSPAIPELQQLLYFNSAHRRPQTQNAQRTSTSRHESTPWRQCKRNCSTSLPLHCPKRNTIPSSSSSCSIAIEHVWTLYASNDCEESLCRVRERKGYYLRVWSVQSECNQMLFFFHSDFSLPPKFQFRLKALKGELPGVKKASW